VKASPVEEFVQTGATRHSYKLRESAGKFANQKNVNAECGKIPCWK
jgi:hypothetical protein